MGRLAALAQVHEPCPSRKLHPARMGRRNQSVTSERRPRSVLVFLQWAWSYCTFNRAARLITGDAAATRLDARPPAAGADTIVPPEQLSVSR